jgi:hypothetical protein
LYQIFSLYLKKQKTKQIMASKKEELFQTMKQLWNKFEEEHNKTTKVSQKNARTLIGDLKKLVTDYRQASVEETKQ